MERWNTKSETTPRYRLVLSFFAAGCAAAVLLGVSAPAARAMPPNSRQIEGGYWLGGTPDVADMQALTEVGVRVILSLTLISPEAKRAAKEAGLARAKVWVGQSFPSRADLRRMLAGYAPHEIYIHCEWGADRTGAVAAYLLATQQGWAIEHALLAMVYPDSRDLGRLVDYLEELGLSVSEEEVAQFAGRFSGASNGGTGGLKVRSEGYKQLVKTTVEAANAELAAHPHCPAASGLARAFTVALSGGAARGAGVWQTARE